MFGNIVFRSLAEQSFMCISELICFIMAMYGFANGYQSLNYGVTILIGWRFWVVQVLWIIPGFWLFASLTFIRVVNPSEPKIPVIAAITFSILFQVVGFLIVMMSSDTPLSWQVRAREARQSSNQGDRSAGRKRGKRRFEDFDEDEGGEPRRRRDRHWD